MAERTKATVLKTVSGAPLRLLRRLIPLRPPRRKGPLLRPNTRLDDAGALIAETTGRVRAFAKCAT